MDFRGPPVPRFPGSSVSRFPVSPCLPSRRTRVARARGLENQHKKRSAPARLEMKLWRVVVEWGGLLANRQIEVRTRPCLTQTGASPTFFFLGGGDRCMLALLRHCEASCPCLPAAAERAYLPRRCACVRAALGPGDHFLSSSSSRPLPTGPLPAPAQ